MSRTKGTKNIQKIEKPVKVEKVEKISIEDPGCKECLHDKAMHYGGLKGHCNMQYCECLECR